MALSVREPVTVEEFDTLNEKLLGEPHRRHHKREGYKRNVDYYSIVWVDSKKPNTIYGHISGPTKNNAAFTVENGGAKLEYTVQPDPGCKASISRLDREVKHALREIFIKTKKKNTYSGPMNKDNWDGYYLFRNSNGKVSVDARKDFQQAVAEKEVSQNFMDASVGVGIRMELRIPKQFPSKKQYSLECEE